MPVETFGDSGFLITGREDIEFARILAVRSALRFEVSTGMAMSRGRRSTLALANEIMGTNFRTKKQALEALNNSLAEVGF